MSGFRFSLEALLRVRRDEERQHQRSVAVLQAERQEIESRLRSLDARIRAGRGHQSEQLTGAVDIQSLRLQSHDVMHATRSAQRTALELAGLLQRLQVAEEGLRAAMQARRALERLREKRLATWKREQQKADQRRLDDLPVSTSDSFHGP